MRRPATTRWPSSIRVPGQRGFHSSTTGARHKRPKPKRSVRKVNGGAYCSPIFVATYPEPHTATKYQARSAFIDRRAFYGALCRKSVAVQLGFCSAAMRASIGGGVGEKGARPDALRMAEALHLSGG